MKHHSLALVLFAASGSLATGGPSPPAPPGPPQSVGAPPRAWVETERGSRWLGYSSYCWRGGLCVDFVGPSCEDHGHTPRLVLRKGEHVRFHLGFDPRQISLAFSPSATTPAAKPVALTVSRTPSWLANRAGAFTLFAASKGGGDASYVGCIVWR